MNRLKILREEKNLNQIELGKIIGVSGQALGMYENEKRDMSTDTVIKLANYFDVSTDYLLGKSDTRTKTDKLGNPVVSIPILGTVKAGYNYLAEENWIGNVDIDKKLADSGEFFALNVKGDSMSPVLIEGDIVVVKKQDDFENGDIVVALINGDEATIKKAKKSDSSILLQPFNNNYEPLIFTYEEMKSIPVKIIGTVKQLKREF